MNHVHHALAAVAPLQTGQFAGLAVMFVALAVVAYVLGANRVAGVTMRLAKLLIVLFIIFAIVSLLL